MISLTTRGRAERSTAQEATPAIWPAGVAIRCHEPCHTTTGG